MHRAVRIRQTPRRHNELINEFDERETRCIGKKVFRESIMLLCTVNIASKSGQRMNDGHFPMSVRAAAPFTSREK